MIISIMDELGFLSLLFSFLNIFNQLNSVQFSIYRIHDGLQCIVHPLSYYRHFGLFWEDVSPRGDSVAQSCSVADRHSASLSREPWIDSTSVTVA